MTDTVSQQTRSQIMSKVRSKGTKLEKSLRTIFSDRGWDFFEEQPPDIPGHPDFLCRERKIAIFGDSCFWHGCPKHVRMPASNVEYWHNKIARNVRRDKRVRVNLRKDGWLVVGIWEHELPDTPSLKRKLTLLSRRLNQI